MGPKIFYSPVFEPFFHEILSIFKFIVTCSLDLLLQANAGAAQQGMPGVPLAPPIFIRSVNPIHNMGADYTHHSNTGTPKFSALPPSLNISVSLVSLTICNMDITLGRPTYVSLYIC